jgi:hypothetical protein
MARLLILNFSKKSVLNINFESSYAAGYIILSLLLAGGVSFFLYRRNSASSNFNQIQKIILIFLRFLTFLFVFILLFSPLIERTRSIKQVPVIAVALDNSQSVSTYSDSFSQVSKVIQEKFANDDYQLEFWRFGEKVENVQKFLGTDRKSDYGQLLKSLKNSYINKNIGALILIGDGVYNQGQSPENVVSGLKFPVYTIGVGDTTRKTDAIIRNVKTNKIAFLKNKFPVEIEMKFLKLKNKIAYIDIENNNNIVYSSTLTIGSDDDFELELANLDAAKVGMQHYKVKIRSFDGEANLKNNEFEFVIQIMENKQKILMLSDGPHPDLGAIRTSLEELQNYDVKIVTGNQAPDSITSYSLIILNQLPSIKNSASQLLNRIKESRVPVLFIIGPNSMLDQFNSLAMGLKIANGTNTEEVQAVFDNNFGLYTLSDETKDIFRNSPPLLAPFGNTELSPILQNLALQDIRNIQTNKTLLAFGNVQGRKVGFVVGEGIWRWRLFNFQATGNQDAFNELIQKGIQYLALKQNEDNFNVYYPVVFQETDQAEFTAELYNDSYQLINTPDVSMKIRDNNQKEFSYIFDRKDNFYSLNAGTLAPGDYTFEAETKVGSQSFIEKGNFSVVKNNIETQNTQADFNILYQISSKSGGKFSPYVNYGTLLDSIKANKQIKVQHYKLSVQSELINVKFVFFLLILFLGAEWFLRKYWGIY